MYLKFKKIPKFEEKFITYLQHDVTVACKAYVHIFM